MLGIGHFEIASLDKSHDVCLDILAMICHTGPFKNFFAATWHTAEVYYIPLLICYFRTPCVKVCIKSVRVPKFSVRVGAESVRVGVMVSKFGVRVCIVLITFRPIYSNHELSGPVIIGELDFYILRL